MAMMVMMTPMTTTTSVWTVCCWQLAFQLLGDRKDFFFTAAAVYKCSTTLRNQFYINWMLNKINIYNYINIYIYIVYIYIHDMMIYAIKPTCRLVSCSLTRSHFESEYKPTRAQPRSRVGSVASGDLIWNLQKRDVSAIKIPSKSHRIHVCYIW